MESTGLLTTSLMWRCAAIAALIDAPLLALLAWRVKGSLFRQLQWPLTLSAGLVFALIWGMVGSILFWDSVYSHIFPAWFHWMLPLIYGPFFAAAALLFWRISLLAPRGQVIVFCLLGGLISLFGHSIGIGRGLFNVPLLAHTSIPSALVFGIFEFTFYFCAIVILAITVDRLWPRLHRKNTLSKAFIK